MKKVPKTSPRMIATRHQNRFSPRLMPMNPTTRVASSAFAQEPERELVLDLAVPLLLGM